MAKKAVSGKLKGGLLITFEGTEGTGKSTLIRALALLLERQGHSVVTTREPGGSPLAEQIRALILSEAMDPRAELFLYEAARAEHLARTIEPALAAGRVVLCDRFADSSLAYQAHARGLPWKDVRQANRIATQGRLPDVTVLVDGDPAEGLKNAVAPNRFELEGVAFQNKVRQGFLKARALRPRNWVTVRARSGTPEEMASALSAQLARKLPRLRRSGGHA